MILRGMYYICRIYYLQSKQVIGGLMNWFVELRFEIKIPEDNVQQRLHKSTFLYLIPE